MAGKSTGKKTHPFIVNDFETGGLDPRKNAVTEFAMVGIHGDTLQEVCRFNEYLQYNYNPALVYDQKALDITGINIEDLKAYGLPIKEFGEKLVECLAAVMAVTDRYYKPILVGHNITFDIGFMQAVAKECKIDLSKYLDGMTDFYGNFQPSYIDTRRLANMKFQGMEDNPIENYKLGTVLDRLGVELHDAHRAINDVLGTKEGFTAFINDLRSNGGVLDGLVSGINKKIRFRNHFQF